MTIEKMDFLLSSRGRRVDRGDLSRQVETAEIASSLAMAASSQRRLHVAVVGFGLLTAPLLGAFIGCSKHADIGAAASTAAHTGYHCAMHPQYHSDKPGDCPICGMKLVPDDLGPAAAPASSVPGQAAIPMNAAEERLNGVQTARVEPHDLRLTIRASAKVAYDPGLYSAILEHQAAVDALRKSPDSSPYHAESEATVRASRLRLRQMGLSDRQIGRMSEPGFDPANLLLGKAGESVWVYADIYDYEAELVGPGQDVELTSPAFPGRLFHGAVRAVDSNVNAKTRTLRARIETPNPDGDLKPDMFLNAAIHADLGRKLAVPEAAVIDTGARKLVYVLNAAGQLEPREIDVGRQADHYFEVRNGLQEGDQVSTASNFLIDSESKLRAAAQGTGP